MGISALTPPPNRSVAEDIVETVLEFPDNRLLIDLCGEFDRNLAQIEHQMGVHVLRRGNRLAVVGDKTSREQAAAVLRSLPTMPLRYAAHDAATRAFAHWCTTRAEFARVLHPALPGSPGHDHWKSHCRAAAGLVSVIFAAGVEPARVDAFVDALKLFRIGYSWAGATSLVVPYDLAVIRAKPVWPGTLVRFSIGLEGADDMQADLEQALAAIT